MPKKPSPGDGHLRRIVGLLFLYLWFFLVLVSPYRDYGISPWGDDLLNPLIVGLALLGWGSAAGRRPPPTLDEQPS